MDLHYVTSWLHTGMDLHYVTSWLYTGMDLHYVPSRLKAWTYIIKVLGCTGVQAGPTLCKSVAVDMDLHYSWL